MLKSYEKQFAAGGLSETELITARAAVDIQRRHRSAVSEQPRCRRIAGTRPATSERRPKSSPPIARRLQQAQWKLQQKQIASPRDGLVFDTLYRAGEWVAAGSPIVQILPPENIEVRFFVPETTVGSSEARPEESACTATAAPPTIPAAITFISNQVEYTPPVIYSNENRSKLVFMVIAKPSVDKAPLLHPGQPLEVTLQ